MILYSNNCPICNKVRYFKTKAYLNKSNKKNIPCKSCSNSIQLGGKGCLIKDNKKSCSFCHLYKDFDQFSKNGNGKLKSRCKECQTTYNTQYHKDIFRFERYGITKEIFIQMFQNQEYKCKICKTDINESSSHIDHCHTTGQVRGLLCEKCNKGLGQFDDNIEFLTNAIKYLKNEWN
jgi:hypothetical protein